MNIEFDNLYMELAYKEAFKYMLLTYPNPAVGALILYKGQIIAIEAHKRAGSSHAEVLALLSAYEAISSKSIDFDRFNAKEAHNFLLSLPKDFFKECSIYVTLEPCSHIGKTPSCASLLKKLNLKEVIIGALDPISSHSGGIEILKSVGINVRFSKFDTSALIEPFKIWQNRAFVVFKLAQSLNGVIGGGYLSSKESLIHTHKIRSIIDYLLIGGNTVRVDRPTLDCRFINKSAPNIVIYSKKDNFDRDISLFSVPNREVKITNNLEFLKEPGLVLVEGGEGMLNALKDKIDWLLIYLTPKIKEQSVNYYSNLDLEFLHTIKNGVDEIIWVRVKK